MALTLITANLSRSSFAATNEATSTVLWKGMAVVDVDIDASATVTDYPLAVDGANDAATTEAVQALDVQAVKVIQPSKMRVNALVKDLSIIENMIALFNDPTITMSVNSKSIIAEHLVMTDLEIDQSADILSAARVSMAFEQAQIPTGEGFLPEQAADASVYGLSVQNPAQVSLFASFGKTVNSIVGRVVDLNPDALLDDKGRAFRLDGPSKLS